MIAHNLREHNNWIVSGGLKIQPFVIEMIDLFFGILQRVESDPHLLILGALLEIENVRFGEVMNC
jgi:hypothetical protein